MRISSFELGLEKEEGFQGRA